MTSADSISSYMERKIGSKIIANTIIKTPFFKSLFNIVPGLGYVSLLGGLIDMLKKDSDLTVVLDPPATGHILTMFSSLHNFHEIFGTGIFAKDIERIQAFIYAKDLFKINVIALPTEMALEEAIELKLSLKSYTHEDIGFVVNDSLLESDSMKKENIPLFLKKKIELEKALLKNMNIEMVLPHIFSNDVERMATDLSDEMELLV